MKIEEQILELENKRGQCLEEIETHVHQLGQQIHDRLSPARFFKRHMVPSIAVAAAAGIAAPLMAPLVATIKSGAWLPWRRPSASAEHAPQSAPPAYPMHTPSVRDAESVTDHSLMDTLRRMLGIIIRTALMEIAAHVDIPSLFAHLFHRPQHPSPPTEPHDPQ